MSAAHGSRAGRHGGAPSLITSAQPGSSSDFNSRQIRYLITMGFRVACFIAMIWVPNPWRWVLFAAAVVLPAIAVMFANQAGQRTDRGKFETTSGPRFSITGSTLGEVEPGQDEQPDARQGPAPGQDSAGSDPTGHDRTGRDRG